MSRQNESITRLLLDGCGSYFIQNFAVWPIAAARRQAIEEERWRALRDQECVARHRRGRQDVRSQYVN
jgi:hypothetical protein